MPDRPAAPASPPGAVAPGAFAPGFFDRADEGPDSEFYASPRLVQHIDEETVAALTQLYRERVRPGVRVLDMMSSWVSHLPGEIAYARVDGLGMNADELAANPRLTAFEVHDLNADPTLPYPEAAFEAVLCAVSVQYLVRPVEVFAEVARVLAPGGLLLVAMSHRLFPTKAIRAFHALPPRERIELVRSYLLLARGFDDAEAIDRSPAGADPLWVVAAQREG